MKTISKYKGLDPAIAEKLKNYELVYGWFWNDEKENCEYGLLQDYYHGLRNKFLSIKILNFANFSITDPRLDDIKAVKEQKERPFPKFMINSLGSIVLFTEPKKGYVLNSDYSAFGHKEKDWDMTCFKDLEGEHELQYIPPSDDSYPRFEKFGEHIYFVTKKYYFNLTNHDDYSDDWDSDSTFLVKSSVKGTVSCDPFTETFKIKNKNI